MKRVEQAIEHIAENINGKAVLEIACGCAEFSLAAAQTARDAQNVEGIDRVDLGAQARLVRLAAQGADRKIGVDAVQLLDDCVQNGVVACRPRRGKQRALSSL